MSPNSTAPDDVAAAGHELDVQQARADLRAELQDARHFLRYKAHTDGDGRIRDAEKATVRADYIRTLIQACRVERRLLADMDEAAGQPLSVAVDPGEAYIAALQEGRQENALDPAAQLDRRANGHDDPG